MVILLLGINLVKETNIQAQKPARVAGCWMILWMQRKEREWDEHVARMDAERRTTLLFRIELFICNLFFLVVQNQICGLQLPRELQRSNRLLQLTRKWKYDGIKISITLCQV